MENIIKVLPNKTGSDLTEYTGYLAKFDTDGMVVPTTIVDQAVGVITRGGATESEICLFGDCIAKAGGTVTAGKMVIPHTDGTVKDTTSSSQECGVALQSGVAGDLVKIFFLGANKTVS